MIEPLHIKMALAALDMTKAQLGEAAGVSSQTIAKAIAGKGVNSNTLTTIERYFQWRGLEFFNKGDARHLGEGIGVRFKT